MPAFAQLLNQATLNVQNKSVVDIILDQSVHSSVDIVHGNLLNLTCDVVLATEVQHLLCLLDSTNGAATNPQTACTQTITQLASDGSTVNTEKARSQQVTSHDWE